MNSLIPFVGVTLLLGSALIGGVFFAFSSFVMKALSRLPSSEGIVAMQSINVVVINCSFLGAFFGTTLLSLGVVVFALIDGSHPSTMFLLAGAISYLTGTFAVTVFGNVPLNERLAAVEATDSEAGELWKHYLRRWTLWNHIRTAASMIAALLCTLGILQNVSGQAPIPRHSLRRLYRPKRVSHLVQSLGTSVPKIISIQSMPLKKCSTAGRDLPAGVISVRRFRHDVLPGNRS